ncbi:matrixin family metalloprotease [Liquorilactobacillus sicerae]|uniref:matrixin family metalloprotease n=1 Tax=Liquorilactobacillus sicerae TaxID=1416943 RepID=UPI00247FBD7B|nr:matrixin family metalloprotease [Liquorilactobacillus sicerae]
MKKNILFTNLRHKLIKITVSLAIVFAFGVSITSQVQAASSTFKDPTTTSQTTTSSQNTTNSKITPYSYPFSSRNISVYLENMSSTYQAYWKQAIAAWNDTGIVKLTITTTSSDADITCNVETSSSENYTGITELTYDSVNKKIKNAVSTLYSNTLEDNNYGETGCVDVATHELGHALGLEHNTQDQDSIMWPSSEYQTIDENDIEGLTENYASIPSLSSTTSSAATSSINSATSSFSSSSSSSTSSSSTSSLSPNKDQNFQSISSNHQVSSTKNVQVIRQSRHHQAWQTTKTIRSKVSDASHLTSKKNNHSQKSASSQEPSRMSPLIQIKSKITSLVRNFKKVSIVTDTQNYLKGLL